MKAYVRFLLEVAVMFKRPHHQRIAQVLYALNGNLLRSHQCLFGGGTAIALRFGEYRESVDIDFLVSDLACYRSLRQELSGADGISAIVAKGARALNQTREMRLDQYGIRTQIEVDRQPIKFEVVFEARMDLAEPADVDDICGISTLSLLDMAASKLLANSDRWNDESVFSRDLIDLAMMRLPLPVLRAAILKAETTYGRSIRENLADAIGKMQTKQAWLERCMQVMAMQAPKALVWQRVRSLQRALK